MENTTIFDNITGYDALIFHNPEEAFVPSNRTSQVCSSAVAGVTTPTLFEPISFSIKLQPNTSMVANIRVLTSNFSGDPSEDIYFRTTEDPVEVTTGTRYWLFVTGHAMLLMCCNSFVCFIILYISLTNVCFAVSNAYMYSRIICFSSPHDPSICSSSWFKFY